MKKLALMLAVVFLAATAFGQTTTAVKKDGTPDMRYKDNKAANTTTKK